MTESGRLDQKDLVTWMREASPYIRAHRDKTFVIYVGGEAIDDDAHVFGLVQDVALLTGIGVRVVIVHGARPQIERIVESRGIEQTFVDDLRVTDHQTAEAVKEAAMAVRLKLEAELARAGSETPSREQTQRVSGGNFIVARPIGILHGIDLHFTGEVRRVDKVAMQRRLDDGDLVLVSPLGISPTGEIFNLNAMDLAAAIAFELGAAKLVMLVESPGLVDSNGRLIRQLTVREAQDLSDLDDRSDHLLQIARRACQFGVQRVHIVDRTQDGVLLKELFTRDGVGTLVSQVPFDQMRRATVEDVGGILNLIQPLEEAGLLVKRSREKLEIEIDRFAVLIREDTIVACGALYTYDESALGEIACVAVHPDYRRDGFGNAVLIELERRARESDLQKVFVLTTQASDWFQEQGFAKATLDELPVERQTLYNYQRNSLVLLKPLKS
jgi:amino-acid N-acetyltransferase